MLENDVTSRERLLLLESLCTMAYNAKERVRHRVSAPYYAAGYIERRHALREISDTIRQDEIREYNGRYRVEHAEEIRTYNAQYRMENRDRRRQYDKQYKATHPDIILRQGLNRRARKSATICTLTDEEAAFIKSYGCLVCDSCERLEIAHDMPVVRGGATTFDNCFCLCRSCNSKMGTKTLSEWRPDLVEKLNTLRGGGMASLYPSATESRLHAVRARASRLPFGVGNSPRHLLCGNGSNPCSSDSPARASRH